MREQERFHDSSVLLRFDGTARADWNNPRPDDDAEVLASMVANGRLVLFNVSGIVSSRCDRRAQRCAAQLRRRRCFEHARQHVQHHRSIVRIAGRIAVVYEQDVARRKPSQQPLRHHGGVARARIETASGPARQMQPKPAQHWFEERIA